MSPDLVALLRDRAQATPDRVAFTFLPDGEQVGGRRTDAQLDRRARAVAAALQRRGHEGDRVLVVLDEGLDLLDAFFGCLYARQLPVLVAAPDPSRPARTLPRLRAVAADARPAVVLTTAEVARRAPLDLGAEVLTLEDIEDPAAWRAPALRGEDLAYLQYTSGSTAEPKGVCVSHANLAAQLADFSQGMRHDPTAVLVSWLPSTHDLGLVYGRLIPLWNGFPCVFFPPAAFTARPARWMGAMSRFGGTHAPSPNFGFELAARRVAPEEVASMDLSRVRVLLNGAEPIREATEARFREVYAAAGLRDGVLLHAMGMSEATAKIVAEPVGRRPRFVHVDPAAYERGEVRVLPPGTPGSLSVASNGVARPGTRVAIVDPTTREALPEGRVGELWVAGSTVARGYWGRPELTEATFGARTAAGDGPFLRTGDLGFQHEGELHLSGRLKDLIVLRGQNHHPQDLEWAVEQAHPAVRPGGSAAFSAVDDEGEHLVVVLEVAEGAEPAPVLAAVRQALAEHGVTPRTVALLPPRAVPKTTSGKLRRSEARARFERGELAVLARWDARAEEVAPAPDLRARVQAAPPRRRVDVLVRELQERIAARLEVPPDAIDPDRPFGELGLDSVATVELVEATGAALGLRLPPTVTFDHPTPEAMAAELLARIG